MMVAMRDMTRVDRGVRALALGAALCAAAPAQAQQSLPRAPGAHIVTVSPPEHRGNEPGIAVNPRDPAQIVGVYQGPARAVFSTDSGRTFTLAEGTVPSDWRVAADVSTTFDNQGNAYLSYLTFDKLGTTSFWRHGAGRNGIWVRRSADGGKTWEKAPVAVHVWATGNEPDLQYEDMPRIIADNSPKSPHAGNLYMGWIEWQIDKSIMLFSRSTDHGKTWTKPMRISTQAGLPRDDNGGVVGFHAAIASDGTIYASWNWASTITLAVSRDGGKSFAPSRPVVNVAPPYFGGTGGVGGISRVFGFPQIAVDARAGSSGGTLYLSWSDYRNGDVDVFVAASRDRGRTWGTPLRVTTDSLHSGRDQFFQWLTVDPVNGDVYVQFYDRRDDPQNRKTGFTLARSTDGGRTFRNYAWTDRTFEGRGAFLGDYTWLTAYDGRVYGIWAETVPDESDPIAPSQPGAAGAGRPGPPPTIVRIGTADFRGVTRATKSSSP
jgi:hypothetical protein